MVELPDYENLGSFYLGKKYDLEDGQRTNEKVLYDATDLTTHALCVGMTGSGKTGLCLSLLEEAAIDGIPAICIDPKGDIGNLLLTFPALRGGDFAPWVDSAEAARQGMDADQYAESVAKNWRSGLEEWDQDGARIQRLVDAAEFDIYTPGSNAGLPLTVLRSFDAPPDEVKQDSDLFGERIASAASGLLALLDLEGDPLSSPEHILLSNIFDAAWKKGQSLDLPTLIRSIQNPPFTKLGVFDVDSFYPPNERMKLSMKLNNLLASPSFSGWLEGQPLDIRQLLYKPDGKPRVAIISISHLSDQERMFFVTILLNELLAWVRTQPGTSSLRALFYMDEVYGYFPPSAKPPSKPPMMLLLKQARAFGLGVVLATQNPVDLDYKGLSNIGTWFLGRLQTQRDKDRVLDGLEGASAETGSRFNRGTMDRYLSALGKRVFLMNNVHDAGPTIFQTRWAMSYLRGPLSRVQIQELMETKKGADDSAEEIASASPQTSLVKEADASRPVVPIGVEEMFLNATEQPLQGSRLSYRPALFAQASCHYVRTSAGLDDWLERKLLYEIEKGELQPGFWSKARLLENVDWELSDQPETGFRFAELPAEMLNAKSYKRWQKELRDHLYRQVPITIFECVELKKFSRPGQDELDARLAWKQDVREKRDEEKQELAEQYGKKVEDLENRIRTAKHRLERERAQYDKEKWSSLVNLGETVLGAFLGNRIRRKSATTGRNLGRAAQQKKDVELAIDSLDDLLTAKYKLEAEFEQAKQDLIDRISVHAVTLKPIQLGCRKGDMQIQPLSIIWFPWQISQQGEARPLFQMQ